MTRQVAAMVIFYNGRYLFEVRSSPPEQRGLLGLPGGKWEAVDGPLLEATKMSRKLSELMAGSSTRHLRAYICPPP